MSGCCKQNHGRMTMRDIIYSRNLLKIRPADISLHKTEMAMRMNRNQFRICSFPEVPDEDTEERVLQLINTALKNCLNPLHIVSCERVEPSWFGDDSCKDIVVTFGKIEVRNMVFRRLQRKEYVIEQLFGTRIQFYDELGRERARIMKEALQEFGENSVSVLDGAVQIEDGGEEYRMLTLRQYREFLRKRKTSFLDVIEEEDEEMEISIM